MTVTVISTRQLRRRVIRISKNKQHSFAKCHRDYATNYRHKSYEAGWLQFIYCTFYNMIVNRDAILYFQRQEGLDCDFLFRDNL